MAAGLHGVDQDSEGGALISPHLTRIVHDAAKSAGVDPMLALAIVEVESAGDPWAVRFEPEWKYHYLTDHFAKLCRISEATEHSLQAHSFGLMQVMGTVARELGFDQNLLKLTDPRLGAKYGCLKLAKLKLLHRKTDDVIAAYNAGSPRRTPDGRYVNQAYVDKVRRIYGNKP